MSSTNPLLNEIDKLSVYILLNFLRSRGVAVSTCKKADLVMLAKALISLGLDGSVDFHEDPVFHWRKVRSPGIIVALPAATLFHHFKQL